MVMQRDPRISEELKDLAPGLADLSASSPHTVPEAYFGVLPAVILARIGEEESVPAGYFDGLASSILDKITGKVGEVVKDELIGSAPSLAGVDRKMPQTVPDGYFEGLAEKILTGTRESARIVRMNFRLVSRYAAAAAVFGILFSAAWLMIKDNSTRSGAGVSAFTGPATDSLSETAMATYLNQTGTLDGLDASMEEVNKPEDLALVNLDEQKLGEMLTTMTDKELADYIDNDPNNISDGVKN